MLGVGTVWVLYVGSYTMFEYCVYVLFVGILGVGTVWVLWVCIYTMFGYCVGSVCRYIYVRVRCGCCSCILVHAGTVCILISPRVLCSETARERRIALYKSDYHHHLIVQELCESRGGRPGLSGLTSLLVSVDVKIYWTVLRHWSQLVPNISTDIWGH